MLNEENQLVVNCDIKQKADDCQVTHEQLLSCFLGFSEKEVDMLCSFLEYRRYNAETILWVQGDPSGFMVFLVKGKLIVKKETEFPGKYILLAILESGSLCGEISTITSQKRSATIAAVDLSHILILSKENTHKILKENPELGIKLLKHIVGVVGKRLQQAGSRLAEVL